ncbi:Protein MSP1 [Colletotrichum sidae]|uniref:Protein MSP1 n=1 Tax=Colletotrichum sidae TaxID=1347389 RepID=A0A4R8TVA4_9PEZI|nr:Protein MSP1 [Colletotrichum sidae]
MVNDIRNLVARTLPNHDRQYSKEQNVHQHDLAALRNHHDLLCTLFWASPPDLRPGIHNLEKLVIPASSHKEACLINLRAWNQLARFVAQEESSTSFVPLANWQTNVFKQLLDQYNSAASDIQQQFLAMSKDATSNISEAFMSSIVESNKAATMEIMLFSVKSSMDVVKYAGSLELARLASSTVQLQQVFQHFSTLPTDFPSALLQAALTTTERLIGRIERVFNEASGSQNSTSPQTLESEDAILRISHVFKHRKYRIFETVPNKLSMHQRTYLPLFLSTISQRGAEVNLTDIGIDILDLWLLIIVQPNHCLRYENQLGQCLQSQGWEFVPAKATGFVANPGYLSNRSLFEHVMGKMRQHLQCADAATKKNHAARFSKALDSVMLQMRADLQVVASQSPEHPTYVGFVRSIISLITTYGADIRAVHPFFKDVSKVYSPPAEDPQLQAATIQSYGLRLQEGDQRTASTLIHLFLNNFKQALRYGKLPEQVLLLRKAMEIDAIERFTCRHFHPSFRLRKGPSESGADDGKPPDKPAGEQDDGNNSMDGSKIEPSTAPESAFRRPRSAFASARLRGSRQRPVDELPPVSLPQSFLEGNVSLYDPENRINTLTNDLWHHRYMGARWQDLLWKDLDGVFGHASWNEAKLQDALEGLRKGETEGVERRNRLLAEAAQWLSMSIDEMRSSNSLQSAREPLPTTEFADMLRYSNKFVLSNILSQHTRETKQNDPIPDQDVNDDGVLQSLVEQYIGEGQPKPRKDGLRLFDPRIRGEIVTAVRAELALKPDVSMAARELKRPLTVVSIPNYTGRSHSRKLMKHVASCAEADIIHLDAQDLGMLVGDYLGQDCAYSKGPISMLGYRAAEMNGRLAKAEEPQKPNDEDMAGEIEAAWVNIREHGIVGGYNNPMDEELQKIKDGAKDYVLPSVDRWENLKINAVLEEIANTATKLSTQPGRSLIIHVDDFVELNMTLEGALILGRLRAIVDTLWRSGKSVTLVGTSSNDNPSDQYASTLKEIAAEECLIPLPLNFHRITHASNTKKIYEANDYLQENLRNIQHMMKTIAGSSPDTSKLRVVGVSKSSPPQYLLDDAEGSYMEVSLIPPVLATSILPATDVYHVTRLFTVCRGALPPEQSWRVLFDVVESSSYSTAQLHRLQDKPTRSKPPSSSTADNNQRAEPERLRVSGNYNDYEKKLLAGLVNSNEIKTTFDDVHADQETKSALKLLTSLSLVRPEAFTYGVLATDRIPGCLLYGPPGTGKTLLAKAVAKESGANMLEVSGASINDMYVGQSEKNVRALFSLAKKLSPLVIFIDEADALLAARGQRNRAAHRETINQFLREWDGMNDTKAFIMVATNRPFDLDDAVLRRLPRKILVDLPLKADRASILRILLKGENLDDSVSVDDIAAKTVLYSGSDLKNLCVAAAMTAVQEESEEAGKHTGPAPYVFPPKRTLRKHHFDKALKTIAASVSEDMDSLKSIRRFDEKYGDVRAKNSQKKKGMGFGVLPTAQDAEEARVRQAM